MVGETTLELEHEDARLQCRLFMPDGAVGEGPAVLVIHDAMGLGEFALGIARRLAEEGYVALAGDMYGDGVVCESFAEAGKYFERFQEAQDLLRSRVTALFETLQAHDAVAPDRVAALGYCFGGQSVLELARGGADARVVISFHGILGTRHPAGRGDVRAQVVVYTGSLDPYAPPDAVAGFREEMTQADAAFQLTEFSAAYHAFTMPMPPGNEQQGIAYNAHADRVSWAGTMAALSLFLRNGE